MSAEKTRERRIRRARRQARLRRRIRGTAERPRLVVSRSLEHIEGQIVDDDRGVTLTGFSSRAGGLEDVLPEDRDGKVAEAYAAGVRLAERAREEGVEKVVFDRAGYRYHGRVRAFAEGARSGGLEF